MEDVKKEIILKYKIDENTVSIQNQDLAKFYFEKVKNILKSYYKFLEKDSQNIENVFIKDWLIKLEKTFELLSLKYYTNNNKLDFFTDFLKMDPTSSGFPHFKEILTLQSEISTPIEKLREFPETETIQNQMIQDILKYKEKPVYQQFLYTQKKYYEELLNSKNDLFLTTNVNVKEVKENNVSYFSWANYDSSINLPIIYIMECEVSGTYSLSDLNEELKYLTNANLKMITIASKINEKFDYIHPKRIKRVYVGPLYSNDFTEHNDVLQEIIEEAEGNRRFVFCFSEEEIVSYKTEEINKGIFSGNVKKELYWVDKYNPENNEAGVSSIHRKMITPYEIYQKLNEMEHNNSLIKNSDKYIYSNTDEIIGY